MITKKKFGQYEGRDVWLYTLENNRGMQVKIMTYGATVTSISIPNEENRTELACGFDNFESYFSDEYKANSPYFGSTVGRYASRIKDGAFTLGGKTYQLATNDGSNHLHGGVKGFDKRIWSEKELQSDSNLLVLSLAVEDGEEGYPGNVDVAVHFHLTEEQELAITYKATPDKNTPLGLTNHTYFNLSGFEEDIKGHRIAIQTQDYLVPDVTNVPVGEVASVSGFPFDISNGVPMDEVFRYLPDGFEHYFTFGEPKDLARRAQIAHAPSGRKLTVSTTEPGMLFYTGMYTSDQLARENGDRFGKFRAFCCETHPYPNGPNLENAPGAVTPANTTYTSQTTFKLDW
ncbi:galactose mutarotase [Echinicola strongylocentroti]|uniref:Aldose 1-epimerase n=1 Tax=Echinicola strongylocentroti TaxID=1795355 RepID=A0A2Z4IFZ8_9BACT|nr:aldose epimerase family protein [Echinicola strongylocentroti]AWW29526.1 galactose mutarotase [Echinicola strongylocentroti]